VPGIKQAPKKDITMTSIHVESVSQELRPRCALALVNVIDTTAIAVIVSVHALLLRLLANLPMSAVDRIVFAALEAISCSMCAFHLIWFDLAGVITALRAGAPMSSLGAGDHIRFESPII
jgi:hypothetical protein